MPYTFEEYFTREREVYGTSRDDSLTSSGTTVFGLNGNDSLYSTASANYNFLFGGDGNDVYTMATGSALTIFDSGGIDRVIAKDLKFNDLDTYVLTIEGKHIASFNNRSGSLLIVLNWLDSGNQIETIELGDVTLTSAQVSSVLSQRPNFLGDVSLSDQTLARALPFGTSDARLSDYLSYVLSQESSIMSEAKFFSSNGHYYEAISENVTWETAFSLANQASYRGLQGYLVTVTSPEEDRFVHNEVVNKSGITGWGSFAGYQGTWLGASDRDQEGTWKWMNGPEEGLVFATSSGARNITSTSGNYSNFLPSVHEGDTRTDFDFLVSQVPQTSASVPSGWTNYLTWDDIPTNIGSAEVREYGAYDYGVGNGYVIEYGGLPETFSITSSNTSVDEGDSVTFEVLTKNVEWGTSIDYIISGVSAGDLASGALTGSVVVVENGIDGRASITLSVVADQLTEGAEVLTFAVEGQSAFVTINDTSTAPLPPTKIYEGEPLTGALTGGVGPDEYRGGLSGATPFGIDSLQVVDLSGAVKVTARMVDASNPYQAAGVRNSNFRFGDDFVEFDVRTTGGYYPVGIEGSQLRYGDGDSRTTVTANGPAVYEIKGINQSTLSLGGGRDEVDVQLAWNTNSWPMFGIKDSDIDLGSGSDVLRVTLSNNLISLSSWAVTGTTIDLGDGDDSLEVQAINGVKDGQILGGAGADIVSISTQQTGLDGVTVDLGAGNDKLLLLQTQAGALSVNNAVISLGEGNDQLEMTRGTATVRGGGGEDTLRIAGASTDYELKSYSSYQTLSHKTDLQTVLRLESVEQIIFGGDGVTIETSSKSVSYSLFSSSGSSVNEGSTASFTLATTNVAAGTAVAYTISGVSSADVGGGVMSGTVTVGSNSQGTISVPLAADNLTEGTETLTVTAQGKSASVTINDTSTSTAKSDSSSIPQGTYTLNVIVDLFGQVLYLKGLRETVTSTSHTVEHAGTTFNWSEVDSLVTTVTRDGNFTEEFAQEIADAYPSVAGITYATAVSLVGEAAIEGVLIAVAGADGNYVG